MARLFYSDDYTASEYAFDSTRKPAWVAESLMRNPVDGFTIESPVPLTFEQLITVHDPAYVSAIQSGVPLDLAESNCFKWDPGIWKMTTTQSGGCVAAALAAMKDGVSGTLSTGCHHAYRETGKGFCTFNGLALGAKAALRDRASHVLIIDLDAHCGGGTHSLISDDERIWQIDISISNYDMHGETDRSKVDLAGSASRYLPLVSERLADIEQAAVKFDLCLYFAGMDPHEGCAFGGCPGITDAILADRERMVFNWCRQRGIPIAFVIGGGYASKTLEQERLVALHCQTLRAAVGS